jgi:hypothetical protein
MTRCLPCILLSPVSVVSVPKKLAKELQALDANTAKLYIRNVLIAQVHLAEGMPASLVPSLPAASTDCLLYSWASRFCPAYFGERSA